MENYPWRIINEAVKACGAEGPTGTHTMRKNFGYDFYQQTKDVAMLQQIFGHSGYILALMMT
ncbi:tyrosine-type recombinase/integrase [Geobacillus stearothermophilus]|nr:MULTISPECIES: tyrosine-type recombinase/integrase [Geobacillus]MDF9298639.1 tyrosine-type recombinase/integrase [Geobacillus stearothermophilus]